MTKPDAPETVQRALEGVALDIQLLMSGQTLKDAYSALLPAMVNWIICAAPSKDEAITMARAVCLDLLQSTMVSYDSAKHEHAKMQIEPVTKRN